MYFHEWYIQLYGSRRAVSQSLFCGSWQSGSLRCFSRTCQNANFSTPVLNSLIQWVLELCVQVLQRQVFLTFIDLQLRNTSSTIPLCSILLVLLKNMLLFIHACKTMGACSVGVCLPSLYQLHFRELCTDSYPSCLLQTQPLLCTLPSIAFVQGMPLFFITYGSGFLAGLLPSSLAPHLSLTTQMESAVKNAD